MVEISIVMPVYNCEDFLEESLNSVLNQSFTDFEFICVDDGSTDSSLTILQSYAKKDNRLKVFHQENKGGGDARNFALSLIKGKYLIFVDSDDILCPDALEDNYNLIKEKDVDLIFFKAINYDNDTEEYIDDSYYNLNYLYEVVGDEIFSYGDIPDDMLLRLSATPWGKFFNSDFVLRSGAQFSEGIIFHDNKFFWEMLFNSKNICFNNKTFYARRIHSSSIQQSKDKRYLNIFIALNSIVSIFKDYGNLERYKEYLYNWKIRNLNMRYNQIQEQYKQLFLEEFKKDLTDLVEFEGYDNLMDILNSNNIIIYENVLESETYKEYDLLMENVRLNQRINRLNVEKSNLNDKINELKDKNKKLDKKIVKLNKKVDKLKKKNDKLNEKNDKLKDKNKKLKDKNERLDNRIYEYKSRKVVRIADKLKFN